MGVGLIHRLAQPVGRVELLADGIGDGGHVDDDLPDGTVHGAPRHRGAHGRVGHQVVQPRLQIGRAVGRKHAVDQRRLGDHEQRGTGQALLCEQFPQVGGHLGHRLGRNTVEHDNHRRVAIDRRPQRRPRNGVGVPRGGGHEEPQVRGRHQHARHLPVGLGDRVEVGGVEQTHTAGHLVDVNQPQAEDVVNAAERSPTGDARQPRQDVVGGEPVGVHRVAGQHGVPGGRAQHTRGGDRPADEPVDQGRLAAAGGAADNGQQRGVGIPQPGQDVIVELVGEAPGQAAGSVRTGDRQRYPHLPQRCAQRFQRWQQRSGHRFILP